MGSIIKHSIFPLKFHSVLSAICSEQWKLQINYWFQFFCKFNQHTNIFKEHSFTSVYLRNDTMAFTTNTILSTIHFEISWQLELSCMDIISKFTLHFTVKAAFQYCQCIGIFFICVAGAWWMFYHQLNDNFRFVLLHIM